MSIHSEIEWCDSTFNIAWGCMKVSPGCAHCYAETSSKRWGHDVWGPAATTERRTFAQRYWDAPLGWNRAAQHAGVRRRVFCSSMCDVFEDHPTIDAEREKLWPLIRATPMLDWQLLTKRPERISANLPSDWGMGYHNVWLGTSVESQVYADERIPALIAVPAIVRWLSCEPLLGPVSLLRDSFKCDACYPLLCSCPHPIASIDWVIVGGESGVHARPMEVAWARELRDECHQYGTPFFLKQLGGAREKRGHELALLDGRRYVEMPVVAL